MRNKALGFLAFAVGLTVLVIALKTLNWLPLVAQKDLLRRYGDFEEMRSELGIRQLLVPSYFPEDFRWPPTGIIAQGKPYPAVILEFGRTGKGKNREIGLVIFQAAADDFSPGGTLGISRTLEKTAYPLKGRDAVLEVGTGAGGESCARISWREKEFRVTVLARSTPFEVIRVAESMLR